MSWKGGVKKVFECLVLERQGACEADKGWSELEQCGMQGVMGCKWPEPGHMKQSGKFTESSEGPGCGQGALVSLHYACQQESGYE